MKLRKIKPLLPSLREKKRYLAFEFVSEEKLNPFDIEEAIYNSSHSFLGELGLAKAGLIVLKDKFRNNKGILRVNNKYVSHIKSSLMMIQSIKGKDVIGRSLRVSGILNKLKEDE